MTISAFRDWVEVTRYYRSAVDALRSARYADAMGNEDLRIAYEDQARWRARCAVRILLRLHGHPETTREQMAALQQAWRFQPVAAIAAASAAA